MFEKGLFIFHRDLRIVDNVGLSQAWKQCKSVYVCFIFTPEQVVNNEFKSDNAVQFMIETLDELRKEIETRGGKLYTLYGKQDQVVSSVIDELNIDSVFFNMDYSPYAVRRDKSIERMCENKQVACHSYHDYYLFEPGTVLTTTGEAYKKYTPFYRTAIEMNVRPIEKEQHSGIAKTSKRLSHSVSLPEAFKRFTKENKQILVHGGRKNGLLFLQNAIKEQKDYVDTRDSFEGKKKTSHLSAYIKFGCVSIREVYFAFKKKYGKDHGLISELLWREFFAHVLYAYPEVVGQSYQEKYRKLEWTNNKTHIEKWKTGHTGFPLVDAAMREMNATGYMHNRGRMTAASVLIKTLLVDWRTGEKYFAQKLTDYDIASNNGNWQGISGTGVDMKPYFRDMNPWIQSKKFDETAEYIKKWIPELRDVDAKDIHTWHDSCKKTQHKDVKYPCPIVDYSKQKEKMLDMYKKQS